MDSARVYEAADSLIMSMDDSERSNYFEHLRTLYPRELGAQALGGVEAEAEEIPLTAEQIHKREVLLAIDRNDIEGYLVRLGEERRAKSECPDEQAEPDAETSEEPDDEERKTDRIINDALMNAMNDLLYRPRMVIEARFGLDGKKPRTLREIASAFNISPTRVRQIQGSTQSEIYRLLQREAVMVGKTS